MEETELDIPNVWPTPTKIDAFNASWGQTPRVANLKFSPDGTSLAVIISLVMDIQDSSYALHLTLCAFRRFQRNWVALCCWFGIGGLGRKSVTQVSGLHHGHTTAVVEGFDWARDVRWTALGMWTRTVHVFAVNLYGGLPDVKSLLEASVRNFELVVRSFFMLVLTMPHILYLLSLIRSRV